MPPGPMGRGILYNNIKSAPYGRGHRYEYIYITVPKQPRGKQVEYTKALEWTIIKELGKLTTVTSG